MRKPKDRHPKFKKGDKVLHEGQTADVVSNGWWDERDDFRYELDFKYGRLDRKKYGSWIIKESQLERKQ